MYKSFRKKILIVDDDEMIRMMTGKILSSKYDIVSAASGREAIDLYRTEKPDMILSDLVMPEMDGFAMMEELHERYTEVIPVMFMTAYASDESETKGFENGAVDYIRKPFRADVLLHRIDNIITNLDKIRGLQQAAETDPMTGLFNKTTTAREVSKAVQKGEGILMMLDLDSFKLINDLYGHEKGDDVLIWFAETLRKIMRSSDVVGRVGGDEFIAFCQSIRDEKLVAERTDYLNRKIVEYCKQILGNDMNIPIGVSVGAVVCPDEGTDYLTLYKKADHALYVSKRGERHTYTFFRQMVRQSEEKSTENMLELRMVLGERSEKRGGYVLTEEEFKILYRFLVRFQRNYAWDIYFLTFTITDKKGSEATTEVTDKFIEIVSGCIRGSDVLSRYKNNKVLIILCKATDENYQIPVDRMMDRWTAWEESDKYLIQYEKERLLP